MRCPNPDCPDAELLEDGAAYVEGVTVCPRCGAALVAEVAEEEDVSAEAEPDVETELVEAATFLQRQDAEMAWSFLAADGIASVVMADDCGTVNAGVGIGHVLLLVAPEDLERAQELLASDAGDVEGEP